MLATLVVPTVATQASGSRPAARSAAMAAASSAGRMRYASSVAIFTTLSSPSPSVSAPLSTDEWACSEQYTRSMGRSGRPAIPRARIASSGFASRAAARASMVEMDAVSLMMPNQPLPSPRSWRSQSMVSCSSSVAAGEVFHSIALTSSAAMSSSARMPGMDDEMEK
jgi:hypothetical protein